MVMDMPLVGVGCHHILVLAAAKFKCQLFAEFVRLLRRDGIPRREGLYQVVGKVCPLSALPPTHLARQHGGHFKVHGCRLRGAVVAGYQKLPVRFFRVFDIRQRFIQRGSDGVDFCNCHSFPPKKKSALCGQQGSHRVQVLIARHVPVQGCPAGRPAPCVGHTVPACSAKGSTPEYSPQRESANDIRLQSGHTARPSG